MDSVVTGRTLTVPGASLRYEVRGAGTPIALVGAPMAAAAFAPLADLLATDHTVLTTDPRGHAGSVLYDPDQDSTPELRADDLARLLTELGAGPAVVFGSSGGAVTALALSQARPDLVHTVIAHEPPIVELLDDRVELRSRTEEMIATHRSGDTLGAWRQFMANANIPMPEPVLRELFGGDRDLTQLASEAYWFAHEMRATTAWAPDLDALRTGSVRIIAAIGEQSAGQLCDRSTRALAAALGIEPTIFPGDHTGFVSDPVEFGDRLREVLAGR
ncbi:MULTISPECIES: alpha/beta fold hydrolase [unclassified Nocardia]|uniref:alpha/beta fold hydrolase n=1 Tax=unclassified Nocardia TaxID=2637762 RepID=UPI001CE4438D|nr:MULTISPECIES: alpha/beta hydrolase [unclassified Nocardia]